MFHDYRLRNRRNRRIFGRVTRPGATDCIGGTSKESLQSNTAHLRNTPHGKGRWEIAIPRRVRKERTPHRSPFPSWDQPCSWLSSQDSASVTCPLSPSK